MSKPNLNEEVSSEAKELALYAENDYDIYQFAKETSDKGEVFDYALDKYNKELGGLDYDDYEKLKYEFMATYNLPFELEENSQDMKLENHIKNKLRKLKEADETHPGLKNTKSVQDKEKKTNNDYYGDVTKKMKDYSKNDGGDEDSNEDFVLQNPPKKEPSEDEQEYIEDMERSRGLQHFEYDNEPTDSFKERAQKAIEGDSTMGNKVYTGEENGNTESTWGASDDDFGEKLVNQANRRKERTDKAKPNVTSFGDDIEMSDKDKINRTNAFGESKKKNNKKAIKENKKSKKMKRLKFKKNFNGKDNALKLIPEDYKVDGKKFELTDGNEVYRVRWEINENTGNKEGKPIVLEERNNEALQEDTNRMKQLMGFKPESQFGNLKGEQRLQEKKHFENIWNKSKKIMQESEKASDEERITSLNEVQDKLKKGHIPKFSKKPLYEVASSIANKRLSKYNTKFNDINEAYDLKSKLKEGMTYQQMIYVIEEGIKEAARKSLIKEDIKQPKKQSDDGESYNYKTVKDFQTESTHNEGDLQEDQYSGHDPSGGAGAGIENVISTISKQLKKFDKETALQAVRKAKEFLEGVGSAAGGATGTGTKGVPRESEGYDIQEDQYSGHDPSGGAGAGAENLAKKIASFVKKIGDKEKAMAVLNKIEKKLGELGTGTGSATGTGTSGVPRESYEPSSEKKGLIDEDYDEPDFLEDVVFSKLPMEQSPSEFYVVDFPNVESPKEMMQDMEEYGPYKSSREAEEVRDELIDGEIGRISNVRVISGKQMEALSRIASAIAGENE